MAYFFLIGLFTTSLLVNPAVSRRRLCRREEGKDDCEKENSKDSKDLSVLQPSIPSESKSMVDMKTYATSGLRHSAAPPLFLVDQSVLYFDFANSYCYDGRGSKVRDLSPLQNDFTLHSAGGYSFDKSAGFLHSPYSRPMLGPTTDKFRIDTENTIIVVADIESKSHATTFLYFLNNVNNNRMLLIHFPWDNNNIYYDVRGCCGGNQRINYESQVSGLRHYTFRTRLDAKPNRQAFENGVSKADSGNAETSQEMAWGGQSRIFENWQGKLYYLQIFNRALSDQEVQDHVRWSRGVYNI